MRILVLGDLHGKKPRLRVKDFNAVIAPGDFCSDKLVSIMFKTLNMRLKNPFIAIEWYDILGRKKSKELAKKSISSGRTILEFLNSLEVPVFIVPGNWDWFPEKYSEWNFLRKDHYKNMKRDLKNIKDAHKKILKIGDYQIIGYGLSSGPEYPQDENEYFEEELAEFRKFYRNESRKMSSLFIKAKKPTIFLSHNVPFNTTLDKIRNKKSPRYGMHYGSVVARDMIIKHKPLLFISGHMHENMGKCRVGRTLCINTGSGPKVNTLVEMKGRKVKVRFYR